MDDFSMDWDQEIQDMVDDLLLDAPGSGAVPPGGGSGPLLPRPLSRGVPARTDFPLWGSPVPARLWTTDVEPGAGRPRQGRLSHISRVRT